MTSKWLKLSDLPADFWGDCFMAGQDVIVSIGTVKVVSDGKPVWYSEQSNSWFSFNPRMTIRVMPIEMPTITEEDLK